MGPVRSPLLVLLAGALGVVGLPPAMIAAAAPAAAEGDATPSCGGAITIVDSAKADPYPSTISVAAPTGGVITDLNVTLAGVTHTHPEDIRVRVAAPDGSTAAELMSNAGGGDDLSDVSVTFDDEAAAEIPDEDPIASGTYRPAVYAGGGNNFPVPTPAGPPDLSQFDGIDPSGVWSLYVYDDLPGDIGSIDGWELEIDTTGGSVGVGPPVVGGTSAVGQTLSVTSPAMWCPAPTSRTYQWYADDVAISGATGSSYTLTADDLGAMVRVIETSGGIPSAIAASDAVGPVELGTFTSSGTPYMTESTHPVGEPLTAHEGNWSPAPDTSSFEWFVDGEKVGEGSTYTPVAGDLGKQVTVQVTVTRAGYAPRTALSSPRTVTDPNADALKINELRPTLNVDDPDYFDVPWVELYNPTDSAINLVGLELSSNGPALSEAVVPLTGVLPARGFLEVATPGFVERDYFVYLAHSSGRTIDLVRWQGEATASFGLCGDGFDPFPGWSSPGLIRTNTATPGGPNDCNAVLINEISSTGGWVEVINTGSTSRDLTGTSVAASGGEVDLEGVLGPRETHVVDLPNTGYAVFRDIPGPSYDTVAFFNQTTATSWGRCPHGAGHADDRAFFETAAATPGAPNDCTDLVADELPSISGTPRVGDTLTATPAEWPQEPDEVTYQWFADGEPIPGATGPTFVPTPAQAGLTITVVETATEAGHDLGRATSDAVGPVTGGSFTNNAAPSIDGTARAGATVTITDGSWTPAPVERSYEWFVGTELVGVGSSYTPLPGDVGGQLTVVETVRKAGYDDASKTSAPVQVLPGQLVNDAPPTITGTGRVGEQLTANAGSWDPTATGSSFEWFVDGDPRGSGSTYTPVSGDLGKEVVVKETVTRTGYDDATEASTELTVQPGVFTNNAAPSIDGTARAGATVTITDGSWTPAPVERSYEWFVGTELVGVGSSYTPLPGDVGGQLTVVETVRKAGYDDASKTSAPVQVLPGQLVNDAPPTITGTGRVGEQLTANAGSWDPTATGSSFEWFVDGDPRGSGSTYTPVSGDLGKEVVVKETVTRTGYDDATEASTELTVQPGVFTNNAAPSIDGTARAGATVTITDGSWTPAPVERSYEWFVGTELVGVGSSYTPLPGDVGGQLTVVETVRKAGYDDASKTSAPVQVLPGQLVNDTPPTITGEARVGEGLTAQAGEWTPDPVTSTFTWYADGDLIPGATGATFVPGPDELGEQITVVETVTRPSYADETSESVPTAAVLPGIIDYLSLPAITGDPRAYSTLNVSPGIWDPAHVDLAYQWYVDGAAAPGATGDSFTLRASDLGLRVSVRVTATEPGYDPTSVEARWVGPVQTCLYRQVAPVEIRGQAIVGTTLRALPGAWVPEPAATSYQWYADGQLIPGATGAEYTPSPADLGKQVTVRVTVSKPACESSTAESPATGDVELGTLKTLSKPTIVGDLVVGHDLTLEAGEWDADPVTLTYQWTRGGEPIPGATDPTYIPTPDDVTKWLAVVIIVSSPGYADLQSVTPAAFPIAPVKSENTVAPSISGGPRLGETLIADPGRWSFEPQTLAYEWFAGALRIGGQTGPELVLDDPAWMGETISVKVTASSEVQPPATASSDATPPVHKAKPTVEAEFSTTTPKAKRTKVSVDITVTAPAGLPVTGRVRVMVAGKRVATAQLGDGSVRVTLPVFRTKGQRAVVVRYDGSGLLTKAAARTVVQVR